MNIPQEPSEASDSINVEQMKPTQIYNTSIRRIQMCCLTHTSANHLDLLLNLQAVRDSLL